MIFQDSKEFKGKRICVKIKSGDEIDYIFGILNSIEENGMLLSDKEAIYDEKNDDEIETEVNYFIHHSNVIYIKANAEGIYEEEE